MRRLSPSLSPDGSSPSLSLRVRVRVRVLCIRVRVRVLTKGLESESESESLKIWTRVRLEYTVGLHHCFRPSDTPNKLTLLVRQYKVINCQIFDKIPVCHLGSFVLLLTNCELSNSVSDYA